MEDIILSAKRGQWRVADDEAESADKDFGAIRPRVLARDMHTCQFCDWKADLYQDVHHRDNNHRRNVMENLCTACKLCHACYHLGLAGQNNGAVMIYLPEVSQADLNNFLRACWVADRLEPQNKVLQDFIDTAWSTLMARREPVLDIWGSSNPVDFANRLLDIPQEAYDARESVLRPLRLLVRPNSPMIGPKVISYWAGLFQKLPPKTWDMLTSSVLKKSGLL